MLCCVVLCCVVLCCVVLCCVGVGVGVDVGVGGGAGGGGGGGGGSAAGGGGGGVGVLLRCVALLLCVVCCVVLGFVVLPCTALCCAVLCQKLGRKWAAESVPKREEMAAKGVCSRRKQQRTCSKKNMQHRGDGSTGCVGPLLHGKAAPLERGVGGGGSMPPPHHPWAILSRISREMLLRYYWS